MSIAAAVIAAAGNLVGLAAAGSIYGRETAAFVDEAIAQDIVNLAVVAPAIIVLALLARRGSLTAPVHVLDLAFYLPAAFTAGVLLLRNRAWGYGLAPALLGFLTLTGLPIMVTPFVASQRGDTPAWAVLAPMAAVTIISTGLLIRLLSAIREPAGPIIVATELGFR